MGVAATDNLPARSRPRQFDDVIGSAAAKTVLRSSAAAASPPSAILLSGGSGTGKTTLARVFCAGLFCPHADAGNPCGECDVCVSVSSRGGHPDLVEVDAASSGGVDAVRELSARAALTPALARWRVHIIDEAHGLTKEGAGAFLKLLEEPPSTAVFILATTDPHKLPAAIRGRCVHLPVSGATHADLMANLHRICTAEGWDVPEEDLATIVDVTDPDLGVRGTVANLAAAVSIGGQVSDALGAAPGKAIGEVLAAASDRATVRAVAGVEALMAAYPVPVLVTQLTSASRRRLVAALGSDVDDALNWLHVWKAFACAPDTTSGLLLATAEAARGDLSTADSVASLTDMALAAGDRLADLLSQAGKARQEAAEAAAAAQRASLAAKRAAAAAVPSGESGRGRSGGPGTGVPAASSEGAAEAARTAAKEEAAACKAAEEEAVRKSAEEAAARKAAEEAAARKSAEEAAARKAAEEAAARKAAEEAAARKAAEEEAARQAAEEEAARKAAEEEAARQAVEEEAARKAAEEEAARQAAEKEAAARKAAEAAAALKAAEEEAARQAAAHQGAPQPNAHPTAAAGTPNLPSRTETNTRLSPHPTITLTGPQLESIAERSPAAAALLSRTTLKNTPNTWTLLCPADTDIAVAAAAAAILTEAGRPTRLAHT